MLGKAFQLSIKGTVSNSRLQRRLDWLLAQCMVTKTVDLTWGISLRGKSPSKIIIALTYMFPYYPNLQTSKHLAMADSTVVLPKIS